MRIKRLRNLKIDEVSFVKEPAFLDAKVLLRKAAATLDGIKLAGRPLHPWTYIEGIAGGAVCVIATGIVLAAGDDKPGGGAWTADEVGRLYMLWARLCADDMRWQFIRNQAGELTKDS